MKYFIKKTGSKNISVKKNISLVKKIKEYVKKDEECRDLFKKYNKEIDLIDYISLSFDNNMEGSAKTVNGRVYLNSKLAKKPFVIIMRYVVHELVHVFQHMKGIKSKKEKNYLDIKEEEEAFAEKIKFDAEKRGEDKAEEYVEDLLEYHKYPKKEREKKFKKLTLRMRNGKNNTNKSREK